MVRLPFSLLFTSAVIIAVGSFFYRVEIMEWLYPRGAQVSEGEFAIELQQSARVYGILMFGFLGSTTMYVFSTLLTAKGSLKQLNIIALTGIFVNFALNLVLIPRLQSTGAAIASLSTQLLTAGAYMVFAYNYFHFKIDYRFFYSLGLFIILVIVFNYFSRFLPLPWLVSFSLMLVVSLIAAVILKLFNLPEMYRLVKEKTVPS